MLFGLELVCGAVLVTVFVLVMLFTNSYKRIERAIIGFVSIIGLSFIYELFLVDIEWPQALRGWVMPSLPQGSLLVVMSVLGAVVMPHNLFLHSEVVQSREYHKRDDATIRRRLKYEFADTLFSMLVGWAINSAMILLAATTFHREGIPVEELQQAQSLLQPLLGGNAAVIFALALLLAGISSTITSGMAAGSIFAGMFDEPYNIRDTHSQVGVVLSLGPWFAYFSDGAQPAAALHRVPAGVAHVLAARDGEVCQPPVHHRRALPAGGAGDGAQPVAAGIADCIIHFNSYIVYDD